MRKGLRGEPKLGRWDYDGRYSPYHCKSHDKTFSVGIFQWVQDGDKWITYPFIPAKLKRGPVVCRVRGLTSEPEMVYKKAEEICRALEVAGGAGPQDIRKFYTAERRAK